MSKEWSKPCSCGREYNWSEWNHLDYVGIQNDGVSTIELRNCCCRTTLAIEVLEQEQQQLNEERR